MRSIAPFVLILGLAGCGTVPDDAVAVLFEHRDFPRKLYCLAIQDADPSPALLARIHAYNPKVHPAGRCRQDADGHHTIDGASARLLVVTDIRWSSPSVVTIKVFHDSGFMFGSSLTRYKVEKLAGRWIATDSTLEMIS